VAERKRQRGAEPERGGAASRPEVQAAKEAAAKREARAKSGRGSAETRAAQKTEERAAARTKAKAKSAAGGKPEPKAAEPKAAKPAGKAKPKAAAEAEPPERPVVTARARFVRVAPRKVRLVADQIRGLGIDDARSLLRFSARGAARDLHKLLDSAAANAENNHDLIADDLRIAEIRVDEGPTLRRYRPRALGRATRIDKRTSHISVALVPED
jgi:ribosomal protein L22